jgi:serine/threonine-protein kinase
MEAILAILLIFGSPVFIVGMILQYRLKAKQLDANKLLPPAELLAMSQAKQQLESRVANLESIVCSVEFELNERLIRVAEQASEANRVRGRDVAVPVAVGAAEGTLSVVRAPAVRVARTSSELARRTSSGVVLDPGQSVLDRYRVERALGRGAMGSVYLAHDDKLGERVALKVVSSHLAIEPAELVERFRREVQAARKVTHPNVIRIYDLGEDDPLLFLSMEYVEGQTLAALVTQRGPMPLSDALATLQEVTAGVAAAHAVGVVHRDLKPQNVLVGRTTEGSRAIKVIDFGLAKALFMPGMTATGLILGTPEYMAPEQVRGGTTDERTDVYALGALAYFLLCGRPPFSGDTPIAIGFAHLHEAPRRPIELRADIPPVVEAAILRALAKQPGDRFQSASELSAALRH